MKCYSNGWGGGELALFLESVNIPKSHFGSATDENILRKNVFGNMEEGGVCKEISKCAKASSMLCS